jgi:hypothetical protein
MNKENCKESLEIYKKFLTRTDQVTKFLAVAQVRLSCMGFVYGPFCIMHAVHLNEANMSNIIQHCWANNAMLHNVARCCTMLNWPLSNNSMLFFLCFVQDIGVSEDAIPDLAKVYDDACIFHRQKPTVLTIVVSRLRSRAVFSIPWKLTTNPWRKDRFQPKLSK